jgi:hypothetical protein
MVVISSKPNLHLSQKSKMQQQVFPTLIRKCSKYTEKLTISTLAS